MKDKKNFINSLIRETIFETFKTEDKIMSKQDAKNSLRRNKKNGIVSKEKKKESDELIRLTVGGFTQAFDAMERAIKELKPKDYKKFASTVLQYLKKSGANDIILQYFNDKLSVMDVANSFKDT